MTKEISLQPRFVLLEVLRSAEDKDFSGYGKFDALNSPFLDALSLGNRWLRFFFTQAVKELPFNLRPLLGVRQSRNPKGIALFARAYLFHFQETKDPGTLGKAEALLDWLLRNPSPGFANRCWGYNFRWQSPIFFADRYAPNAVVTVFVGEALIHAFRVTGRTSYLDAARSVAEFITRDLPVLHDSETERAVAYVPSRVGAVVVNNQALTGALLAKIWRETGEERLLDIASRQIRYAINRRTPYHAWYYTHPAEKSHISHDNYHTGGILDGILEFCEETGDLSLMDVYCKGLAFYRDRLFEADGAPRWMSEKKFPCDIHGSAQGIITFTKAAAHDPTYRDLAMLAACWAIENLYRPKTGDFAYRRGRWMKWNYSLMRWCNAWMARALAEYTARSREGQRDHAGR